MDPCRSSCIENEILLKQIREHGDRCDAERSSRISVQSKYQHLPDEAYVTQVNKQPANHEPKK
jgi:hypothetical protein